jgi:hypothetical protein
MQFILFTAGGLLHTQWMQAPAHLIPTYPRRLIVLHLLSMQDAQHKITGVAARIVHQLRLTCCQDEGDARVFHQSGSQEQAGLFNPL